jgi:hypothetical protein
MAVNDRRFPALWRAEHHATRGDEGMTDLTDFLNVVASAEDWAGFGVDDREPDEPMNRFTIDVPVSLHRRVRAACARGRLKPSSVLRDLLEREFPDTSGQFRLRL